MTEPTVRRQAKFLDAGLIDYLHRVASLDPAQTLSRVISQEKAARMEEIAFWAMRVYASTNWDARPLWWKIQRHRNPDTRIVLRYRWP